MASKTLVFSKLHQFLDTQGTNIDFISIYVNYQYFLGICPFRLSNKPKPLTDIEQGNREVRFSQIKSWLPQKIFCMLGHILSCFWLVEKIRKTEASKQRNAAYYIRMADLLLGVYIKAGVLKMMWFNQEEFLKLSEYIRKRNEIFKLHKKKYTIMICFLCGYNTLLSFFSVVGGIHIQTKGTQNTWNSTLWLEKMMVASKHLFFLENNRNQNVTNVNFFKSWDEYILFPLTIFGFVQRRLLSFYCDIRLLKSVYTLWIVTNHFHCEINESCLQKLSVCYDKCFKTKLSWKTVNSLFADLKELSEILFKLIGTQVTCMLVQFTFHDSRMVVGFRKRLDNLDWGGLLKNLTFTGTSIGFLYFAADACHKVLKFIFFCMRT